jgi:hypothetical protein
MFFQKLARLASACKKEFSLAQPENNLGSGWPVGFCFYSPSLNFTRIWLVGNW